MKTIENREFNPDKPVEVYRNLRNDRLSVRQSGLVIAHVDHIVLKDVQFVVQPAGQAKARREGQRNVHAFAKGMVDHWSTMDVLRSRVARKITYNPFRYDSFVYADDKSPVFETDRVFVEDGAVWEI